MRRVGDTQEGAWLAEPWGSISEDHSAGVKETPAHRKLRAAQGGGPWLFYHSAVSSLHGRALWEAGKAAEPPRPRSRPGRESWSGEMGWDGKGSMSDIRHPQPHRPLGERWQCLHVLLPSTATRDLAFLVQEVDDSAQHSHHEDGHDDGHDDHALALCC